jgi:hypothetical protein
LTEVVTGKRGYSEGQAFNGPFASTPIEPDCTKIIISKVEFDGKRKANFDLNKCSYALAVADRGKRILEAGQKMERRSLYCSHVLLSNTTNRALEFRTGEETMGVKKKPRDQEELSSGRIRGYQWKLGCVGDFEQKVTNEVSSLRKDR